MLNAYRAFAEVVGWLAVTWAGLALVLGPQWVRNDLRNDLPNLGLLRSYPLRGRSIVGAETAASAIVLSALQLALLSIAYLAFLGDPALEPGLHLRSVIVLLSVVCLPGINYLGMLIQNGAALLFPAWVRVETAERGVEALGQNMLMIVAYGAALAVALAVPALVAGLGFELLRDELGWWAAAPAAVLLLCGIAVESAMVLRRLGTVFEATDPPAAGIAA